MERHRFPLDVSIRATAQRTGLKSCFLPGRMGFAVPATLCLLTLAAAPFAAQAQTLAPRISGQIDDASRVTLRGSHPARALAAEDTGRLQPGTQLGGMSLAFSLSATQQASLKTLIAAQQSPTSALYHHWLTPSQYAAQFGMSNADLSKAEAWLTEQGFSVTGVNHSRTRITFSGTAGQVESAFGTELHTYAANGETHFAPSADLTLPSALAAVTQGVTGLSSFRPRSHMQPHTGAAPVHANFTSAQSGDHYVTPGDVATIYDIKPAYNEGYTGANQTIAVVGQSEVETSDIEAFQTAAGLTVKDPTLTLVPNTGTAQVYTGDEAESDLDLEYSGAIAKGATIDFVYSGNSKNASVWDSIEYAVDEDLAPIITTSYGDCETDLGSSNYATLNGILEQAAAQGQSVIAAAGDDGSTDCYEDADENTGLSTTQLEALAVDFPGSSEYVTAMGGTEFPSADVAASNTTYWQSASGSDVTSSALSYIPEGVWNDDTVCVAYVTKSDPDPLCSGGGGVSTLTARPSWQMGVSGIPSGTFRVTPDIALAASPYNAGYLFCTSDDTAWSTGQKASCNDGFRDSSSQDLTVAGGTSFDAPIFAGMLALINQKTNSSGQGVVSPTLYTLASNPTTYASAFHDITSGNNECTAGSTYCSSAGESEYAAGTGYDEASGLGSVDLYNLLTAWPASSGTTTTSGTGSFTLSAANVQVAAGASGTSTVTITSQNGYAGTVKFALTSTNAAFAEYGCSNASTVTGTANANSTTTTTLTIYTSQSACTSTAGLHKGNGSAGSPTPGPRSGFPAAWFPAGSGALALVVLLGFRRRGDRVWAGLGCVLLLVAVGGATGCGSSNTSSASATSTTTTTTTPTTTTELPAGTYTMTLVGTDTTTSSITANATFTLTVE